MSSPSSARWLVAVRRPNGSTSSALQPYLSARPRPRSLLPHMPATASIRPLTIQQLDAQRRSRQRIVVLGSGWAGYTLSRQLDPRQYQVVVVSPRSYFVFTPLLSGTSVGTLEFRTVLEPVRSFKGRDAGAEFVQGWADAVDFARRTLTVEEAVDDPLQGRSLTEDRRKVLARAAAQENGNGSGEGNGNGNGSGNGHNGAAALERAAHVRKGEVFDLSWDKLVVAVGCYAQTFGIKGVKENAFFLKDVGDARKIRNRLLTCFETAALPTTSDKLRRQLLNFAVVGGGPTGTEWAAELDDLVHEDLSQLYPELTPLVRITVYDVAPKVLSMFDERLSRYAMESFKREGIDIKTNHHVEELRRGAPGVAPFDAHHTSADDHMAGYTLKVKEEGEVGIGLCVWSTGLMMNPFVANALAGKVRRHEKTGGILTDERLQVQREADGSPMPDVFALGDCAVIDGSSYPATAQVASQKAQWLAKRLNKGDLERAAFRYKDLGIMSYIGNRKAILQSAGGDISGRMAWLVWRGAYLAKSMSWRNRVLILIYWTLNRIFGRDISRF